MLIKACDTTVFVQAVCRTGGGYLEQWSYPVRAAMWNASVR